MSLRSLRVLAGFALMLGGLSAQAEMLPGTVWYSAVIKMQEPAPSSAVNEYVISSPTVAGCQSQVTSTIDVRTSSPYFYSLISLSGCSFHISGFASAEAELQPVLFTDFNHYEGVLRERYRIDEYEVELSKLYQRLQPAR
ncbi:hypothetical protein [Tahibacter sp.]|uniref:hypothetical protein n=1 Tax=Tahibacter sp. TaxID=2056211 RepID=UPI0028C3A761|nr:hypothetical protein [Tahibacter sp.]